MSRLPLSARARLGLALAVAAAIGVGSVLDPGEVGPAVGPLGRLGLDVWLHAAAYAVLSAAAGYALLATARVRPLATAAVLATGYGLLLEGVQYGLPYRTLAVADGVANALGAAGAAAVLGLLLRAGPAAEAPSGGDGTLPF